MITMVSKTPIKLPKPISKTTLARYDTLRYRKRVNKITDDEQKELLEIALSLTDKLLEDNNKLIKQIIRA